MKTLIIFTAAFFFYFSIESEAKIETYTSQDPLKESIKRGSEIYSDFCLSCHLPAGEGVAGVFPPLAKSDYLMQKRKESIEAIKYGLKGEIIVNGKEYKGNMAALGLADDEVADVMNYITNNWGNENDKMVTEEEVSKIKK
jgi:mono/diheme cytochrome c family protein